MHTAGIHRLLGISLEQFYDAYYAYAVAAKKLGDVAGRKMIFPGTGTSSSWDYDFVQAVSTETIADYGKNWTNFFWKIMKFNLKWVYVILYLKISI